MMAFSTEICCLIFALANLSYVFGVTLDPMEQTFPMEGSSFEVTCTVRDADPMNKFQFGDRTNRNITDSLDGNRKFSSVKSESSRTLKLHWKSLPANDEIVSTLVCVYIDTNFPYRIIVIPSSSKPTMTLLPENTTTVKKGEDIKLSCSAALTLQKDWSFALQWVFNGEILGSKGKYTIKNTVDQPGNKSSILTVTDLNQPEEGVYTCQANIEISNHQTNSRFSKKVIVSLKSEIGTVPKNREIVRQDQESVELSCDILGNPFPTFRWQKGDEIISASSDARYSFSNNSQSEAANSSFSISKVTYKDRSKYYCIGIYSNGKSVQQEFILRVRDPMGALWPTIGIIIEAVLLVLIIGLYTCCKKSKSSRNDCVDGPPAQGETSPLVKDTSRISYTTGEDGVRARLTANENA